MLLGLQTAFIILTIYSDAESKRGVLNRDVVLSPSAGANSDVASWIINLNGSPPKATAIFNPNGPIYWVQPGKSRRLLEDTKLFEIVNELVGQFLEDTSRRIPLKHGKALVLLQKGSGETRYDDPMA
jgi:hypothetical protein